MIVAIHQPNFCPWLPYFEKIRQADIFVVMGHCQFSKGVYQNRFHDGIRWQTMSVKDKIELIISKKYIHHERDWNKITGEFPKLKVFDGCINDSLFQTNYSIIMKACQLLGIDENKIVKDYPTQLLSTDRLVDICQRHGATKYLAGASGKKYMDLEKFNKAGIEVITQPTPKDMRPLCFAI